MHRPAQETKVGLVVLEIHPSKFARARQVTAVLWMALDIYAVGSNHQGMHLVTAQRRKVFAQDTIGQQLERLSGPALLRIKKWLDHHEGHVERRPQVELAPPLRLGCRRSFQPFAQVIALPVCSCLPLREPAARAVAPCRWWSSAALRRILSLSASRREPDAAAPAAAVRRPASAIP